MTELTDVSFEKGTFTAPIQRAYESYKTTRENLNRQKPQTLMDMATIAVKELKAAGKLDNLDESEEINACTIIIPVDVDASKKNGSSYLKTKPITTRLKSNRSAALRPALAVVFATP